MGTLLRSVATFAAGSLVLAACGTDTSGVAVRDRTGAETVVLRFATFDGESNPLAPGISTFIETLESSSNGGLRIELTYTYGDGAADAESRLVEAIASGDLDGGWPSTRAFARAGIAGLDAIEAPMTLTNYDALKALVAGSAAERTLAALDGSGIAGLSLAVGELRRPFATDGFLLAPGDWQGVSFRSYNSPIQTATIEALGGTAIDLSFGWVQEAAAGRLGGIESGIATHAGNSFSTEVPYVTANVVLWPKVLVLALSQERLDSLTPQQRAWVGEAAEAAVEASQGADFDESTMATDLCESGVHFATASQDELAALEDAVQPVLDDLAASEADAGLLADVLAIAEEHPAIDVPEVPDDCIGDAPGGTANVIPDEVSSLPEGQYRTEIRLADVTAGGLNNGPGWTGTWTLTIEDGTYVLTCRAIESPGKDCGNNTYEGPLEAGRLLGRDDVAYFDWDEELMAHLTGCQLPATSEPRHCASAETYWATWTLEGDRLTFSDAGGPMPHHLTLQEWQKID